MDVLQIYPPILPVPVPVLTSSSPSPSTHPPWPVAPICISSASRSPPPPPTTATSHWRHRREGRKAQRKLTSEGGGEPVLESLRQLGGVWMISGALPLWRRPRSAGLSTAWKSTASEQACELTTKLYRRWKALADTSTCDAVAGKSS
jgi:hypothetical protein